MNLKKIKWLVKNSPLLYSPIRAEKTVESLLYRRYWTKPIVPNRVVLTSFYGRFYNDHPAAITERLKLDKDAEIIWLVRDPSKYSDPRIRFVKIDTPEALECLATARVWVDNCRKHYWINKRPGQFYIQTWHGNIPGKKVEGDAEDKLPYNYLLDAKHDGAMADVIVSNSRWSTERYRESFWFNGEIKEFGSPRLDDFINGKLATDIYNDLSLDPECHYIFYGPTFRDTGRTDVYHIDFDRILREMEKLHGGQWKFLIRLHPNISDRTDIITFNDRLINVSRANSLYDLIMISDYVISDYSSWIFEAGMILKPVFLYAEDLEDYIAERGCYFDTRHLPFPYADNNDQLVQNMLTFDKNRYAAELTQFNDSLGIHETGQAAQLTADLISQTIHTPIERR